MGDPDFGEEMHELMTIRVIQMGGNRMKHGEARGSVDNDTIVRDYLSGIWVPELARKHRHTNRTISRVLREARAC